MAPRRTHDPVDRRHVAGYTTAIIKKYTMECMKQGNSQMVAVHPVTLVVLDAIAKSPLGNTLFS